MLQQSQPDPARLARLFHALSDPSRLDMVDRLSRGAASVGDIAGHYPMSLSAVLQHLKVLETGGLIRSEKVGRIRTCRIDPEALEAMDAWVGRRRAALSRKLDRLETYLDLKEAP